ncbi:MAG: hypothetical protein LOD91_04125 [Limnochordales bacterium]|nr:FGGY family carbohydrate kinase [Limnochordales bacterium]
MACFIGVDIGTSSSKAVLVDEDGRILSRAVRRHPVLRARPGWAEHDPERHWWGDTVHLVRTLLDQADGRGQDVAAIGCSGVCPVVLPVDKDGQPLRPAILYSIDTRALAEAQELERQLGRERIVEDSGQPLSSQSVVPKLLWLRRHEPAVWARTHKILGATGYLVFRLSGAMVVDPFTAGDGGLGYTLRSGQWNEALLAEIGLPADLFPRLAWPTEVVGTLQAEPARELGLPPGIPVVAGTGDALAEMVAAGVHRVGETALLYGSTLTTMTVIDEPWLHPGFISVPGWRPGTWVTSAVLGTGAELLNWWSRVTARTMDEKFMRELDEAAAAVPPGAEGLTVIPYLTGQRSPQIRPHLRGAFLGMTPAHGFGHFARALMEGAGMALRACLAEIPEPWRPAQVVAAGGGTASRVFLQIVSDLCRIQQHVCDPSVNAALGSAMLAATAVGGHAGPDESLPRWAPVRETVTVDAAQASLYDAVYDRFRAALAAVAELPLGPV